MPKPVIILVPGIGDDTPIYNRFAAVWRRQGYEAHVVSFGWKEYLAPLQAKLDNFLQRFDDLTQGRPTCVIGVSAGGTAAVHLLAKRPNVQRIATIGSPYELFDDRSNKLLAASTELLLQELQVFNKDQKARILSVTALYDQVVPLRMSKPEGVKVVFTPMFWHAPAIYVALVLRANRLKRFFSKGV
jgi:alpha-beta hydrolase superfamily lysophospholipase